MPTGDYYTFTFGFVIAPDLKKNRMDDLESQLPYMHVKELQFTKMLVAFHTIQKQKGKC